jgi:hypothetical protein
VCFGYKIFDAACPVGSANKLLTPSLIQSRYQHFNAATQVALPE